MILENLILDEENLEFSRAIDLVGSGAPLIYLTGKAGTGKTTFLKYLKTITDKNIAVVAFTGVAAINAGGQTINSFFKIPFGPFVPDDKRLRTSSDIGDIDKSTIYNHFRYNNDALNVIKGLELLVIDEVSMVRCDMLDVIDKLLKVFRKNSLLPFGGVQVVLIGDTFQLPPIDKDWHLLENYYKSPFFFSSNVIEQNKPIYIELKKVYRQKELEFINLLDKIRVNQISENELDFLNSKYNPGFLPDINENFITLTTHNNAADNINITQLTSLVGNETLFEAEITGEFPENSLPTDRLLRLKENAQIIFVKNDRSKGIYNGRIAKIAKIDNKGILCEFESNGEKIEIKIEKQTWNNIRYSWNETSKKIEEEIIGTFTQFPIKLAWAITVHKSQGLTFDKVIADVGGSFASGQVYVALSRCTTSNGLILRSLIPRNAIKTDKRVIEFAQNETPETLIFEEIKSGKADSFYKEARKGLDNHMFDLVYENVIKAFKFRNDIETPIFKRYFIQKAKQFSSYKYKFVKVKNELSTISDIYISTKINFQKLQVLDLEKDDIIKTLKINNQGQSDAIEKLSEKLKLSELLTQDLAKQKLLQIKEIEKLEDSIDHLTNKKNELKKIKDQKNEEIYLLKTEVKDKIHEIEILTNEIKRINSISWYQKLFGKR